MLGGFATPRSPVPGEHPLLGPSPGPAGCCAANSPPFPLPPPCAGRPPSASPCPSRLNPGLPDTPARSKSRFPDSALGPLPLRSSRRPSGLGTGEGAPGRPFPAPFAQLRDRGAGSRPSTHPRTPHSARVLGPCPNPKQRRARRRQRGARAPGTRSPPFMPPPSGGLARPCCSRPAGPPAVGREGSYARRRCADLLGKIPGFRPVNRPRVTV